MDKLKSLPEDGLVVNTLVMLSIQLEAVNFREILPVDPKGISKTGDFSVLVNTLFPKDTVHKYCGVAISLVTEISFKEKREKFSQRKSSLLTEKSTSVPIT